MQVQANVFDASDVNVGEWEKAVCFSKYPESTPEYVRVVRVDGEIVMNIFASRKKSAEIYAAELAA